MTPLRPFLPYLLVAPIAAYAALLLYPIAGLDGGLASSVTADQVETQSATMMDELQIDRTGMFARVEFKENTHLLRQLHARLGLREGNAASRTSEPSYVWEVRWSKQPELPFRMTTTGDDKQDVKTVAAWLQGDVSFTFDQTGRLFSYERSIPESVGMASLSPEDALAAARTFFGRYFADGPVLGGIDPARLFADSASLPRRTELVHRTDFTHEWRSTDAVTQNTVVVSYRVSGPLLSRAAVEILVPEAFKSSTASTIHSIYVAVLYMVTIVVLGIVTFKRFRAYELGFRLASIVGTVTGLILGIRLFITLSGQMGYEIIFPVLFGPLFYGGALILVWAAAETAVREAWRDKIVSLDLLANGYVFHSRIGASMMRGTSLGLVSVVLIYSANALLGLITPIGITFSDDSNFQFLSAGSPLLSSLMEAFYANTYTVAFFLMFIASRLFRRTSSMRITAAGVVLVLMSLRVLHFEPVWTGILLGIVGSIVIAFAFLRFDILTAFMTMVTARLAENALMLQAGGNEAHLMSAVGIGGTLVVLMVTGALSQYRRRELTEFDSITPAFAKHITERERLQHELSIARQVQMSFLPKHNPVIASLDIASRCAPALEVGGDYYDFIELSSEKLAVAIGDVSGKGTQAAFFMTLTKGFLRALAQVSTSPSAILNSVNRLFYENVDRGVFISLICGVFDTSRSTLTIARAGHNPVILRKSQQKNTQVLNPTGLALGLDPGDIFARSIKEVSVSYEPGDVFVFYTDGVSEAMNRTLEEFGEERLAGAVELHGHKDAAGILDGILSDVQRFVGKAKQHDDVTMVVVKIAST